MPGLQSTPWYDDKFHIGRVQTPEFRAGLRAAFAKLQQDIAQQPCDLQSKTDCLVPGLALSRDDDDDDDDDDEVVSWYHD